VVVVAINDAIKPADRFGQRNVFTGRIRKDLCNEERLREKLLNFAGTINDLLVFLGQLIHTQNGNDVLQFLVALQYRLHTTRTVVVFLANDQRVENA